MGVDSGDLKVLMGTIDIGIGFLISLEPVVLIYGVDGVPKSFEWGYCSGIE